MSLIPVIEELLILEIINLKVLALVYVHLGLLIRFEHVLIEFFKMFMILGSVNMVFLVKITVFHIKVRGFLNLLSL